MSVAFVAATIRWFVWPSVPAFENVQKADAVAVFVGGRGERLDTALRLLHAGLADNLVLPNGTVPTWPQANRLCRGKHDFKVYCPSPDPDSTRGEAHAIASIAHEQQWGRVIAVTSLYHVTRARMLLGRCFDGSIETVRAGPGLGVGRYAYRVAHEWAGVLEASTVSRTC